MNTSITAKIKGTFVRIADVDETTVLAENDVIGHIRRQLNGELVEVLTDVAGTFQWLMYDETVVNKNDEIAIIAPIPAEPEPPTTQPIT